MYSVSSSRFGKTTTIERAVEHETEEAETETIGILHFGSIRADRIAYREEKEKRKALVKEQGGRMGWWFRKVKKNVY